MDFVSIDQALRILSDRVWATLWVCQSSKKSSILVQPKDRFLDSENDYDRYNILFEDAMKMIEDGIVECSYNKNTKALFMVPYKIKEVV